MIIAAHSNLISGLYIIGFELLLPLVLSFFLQRLISAQNINTLYNRKQPLRLAKTRLSLFCNYGLSTRNHARIASLLGSAVLVLTMIGSFSINGNSRKAIVLKMAHLRVSPSIRDKDVINFMEHVSPDGLSVSATFAMARDASVCFVSNRTSITRYFAVGSYDGNMSALADYNSFNTLNISCANARKGFVKGTLIHEQFRFERSLILKVLDYCKHAYLPIRNRTGMWQGEAIVNCNGTMAEVMETWCARYSYYICVTQLEMDVGFSLWYAKLGPTGVMHSRIPYYYSEIAASTKMMQSTAHMMATGVMHHFGKAETMSRLSIKSNVNVQVESGDEFQTEVSTWLFLSTAATAVMITAMVCIWALIVWKMYVVGRELKGRNTVSGAMDIMLLAAAVARDGNGRREALENDIVVVGVNPDNAHVGPLAPAVVEGGEFEEHKVEGRYRRPLQGYSLNLVAAKSASS